MRWQRAAAASFRAQAVEGHDEIPAMFDWIENERNQDSERLRVVEAWAQVR